MEILPRLPRERGRRRPGSARAEAEDRRGPDAAARGERKHRQALGQRVRQFAPRHAGHRPGRVHRSARDREDRRPRRARVPRLPGATERGRHLRRVDRARPRPPGAGARRAARGRGDEPPGGAAPRRREAARPRERGSDHAVARRPGDRTAERPRRSPGRGRPGGVGGATSRGSAAAHDAPHRERRRPAVDANRCPWSATGAAWQRAGLPDDDHACRRAAWCGADAMHRHAADDTAVATILTTAHDIHRIIVAFTSGRISTAHDTAAAARGPRRPPSERPRDRGPRQPGRSVAILGAPHRQPGGGNARPPLDPDHPSRPPLGTPPGTRRGRRVGPVRRTSPKRGEPCPNELFSGSAPRSSSARSTTPAARCGR